MNHGSEKLCLGLKTSALIVCYVLDEAYQRIFVNLLITPLILSRESSSINPSSIFESRYSTAVSMDSRAPLAVKDARKGSASFSETPDSNTISFKKKRSSVRRPSFSIAFGLFFFCGFLIFLWGGWALLGPRRLCLPLLARVNRLPFP